MKKKTGLNDNSLFGLRNVGRTALIYLILIFGMYAPIVFLGKTLVMSMNYPRGVMPTGPWNYQGRLPANNLCLDKMPQSYFEAPIDEFTGYLLKRAKVPLWNPYQGAGQPLAAQYSTRSFFIYQMLQDVSGVRTYDLFYLGRIFLAATFFHFFLLLLGIGPWGAFAGGIYAAFSGTFPWFLTLQQLSNATLMLPVTLFFITLLCRKFTPWRFVLVSLCVNQTLLAANPEVTIFSAFLVGVFVICEIFFNSGPSKFTRFGFVAFSAILGLGLSMPLILPFKELVELGFHQHGVSNHMGFRDPTTFSHALNILLPTKDWYYLGVMPDVAMNSLWDMTGGFLGFSALVFGFLGCFLIHPARKYARMGMAFAICLVLKNMLIPPFSWIGALPLFNLAWSQRWASPSWTVAAMIAAGAGFDGWLRLAPHHLAWIKSKKWDNGSFLVQSLWGLAWLSVAILLIQTHQDPLPVNIGLALVGLLALTIGVLSITRPKDLPWVALTLIYLECWLYLPRAYVFDKLPIGFAVVCLLSCLLAAFPRRATAFFSLAAIFITTGLLDVGAKVGWAEKGDPFQKAPYFDFLKDKLGFHRIMGSHGILIASYSSAVRMNDFQSGPSIAIDDFSQFLYWALEIRPPEPLTFRGGAPGDRGNIFPSLGKHTDLYSLVGVKYLLAPAKADLDRYLPKDRYEKVYDKEISIFENKKVLPRAFFVSSVIRSSGPEQTWRLLREGKVNLREIAIVDQSFPDLAEGKTNQTLLPTVESFDVDSATLSVSTTEPRLMLFSDNYYPGWKASGDGHDLAVYKVDGFLRGVIVTPEIRSVKFVYQPESYRRGIKFAAASLLLLLVTAVFTPTHLRWSLSPGRESRRRSPRRAHLSK